MRTRVKICGLTRSDDVIFAVKAGADAVVLCDTNGGSLPSEIRRITQEALIKVPTRIGDGSAHTNEISASLFSVTYAGCKPAMIKQCSLNLL